MIKARRAALGLTREDLRRRGPGVTSVQQLEMASATSYTLLTLSKVEHGLSWQSGSIVDFITKGTKPKVVDDKPKLSAVPNDLESILLDLQRRVESLELFRDGFEQGQ